MNRTHGAGACLFSSFGSSLSNCFAVKKGKPNGSTPFFSFSSFLLSRRFYHSQHRIPRLPQLPTNDHVKLMRDNAETGTSGHPYLPPNGIHVGYLLHRHPVVKPTLHPLERSMGFLLERQHQLYSRHPSSETACHFFRDRQQESIDAYQRKDPQDIRRDFFGLEGYQDAIKATLQRYQRLPPRLQPSDFTDVASRLTNNDQHQPKKQQCTTPPPRHTLQRKLDDYLYLIVRYADPNGGNGKKNGSLEEEGKLCGKWGIPFTPLQERETLRMAAERCLQEPHNDNLHFYLWGCGPQGTIRLPSFHKEEEQEGKNDPSSPSPHQLFLYSATYLEGKPDFSRMQPMISDHAWVSRRELFQYRHEFASEEFLGLLLDISADAYFETE